MKNESQLFLKYLEFFLSSNIYIWVYKRRRQLKGSKDYSKTQRTNNKESIGFFKEIVKKISSDDRCLRESKRKRL